MGAAVRRPLPRLRQNARFHRRRPHGRGCPRYFAREPREPFGFESLFPPIDVVAGSSRTVASIVANDSPSASIRITCARRASSARILRLRTRRSSSVRSSVVNVSAIWRGSIPLVIQW